jgi:DNA-binding NtrC family response regulator
MDDPDSGLLRRLPVKRSVLVIEPDPDGQSRLAREVSLTGHQVIGTDSLDGAKSLLAAYPVDLILLAEGLTLTDPLGVVAELVGLRPEARIIVVTHPESDAESGHSDIRPARHEALEYLPGPVEPDRLAMLLAS